ncbi:MAG: membrane dipeptidase [Parvularculaceae bacterium]
MPFLKVGTQPYAEEVVAHIEHAVNVAGEDHVGIGCDNSVTQVDDMPAYYARTKIEVAERARRKAFPPPASPAISCRSFPDLQGTDKFRKLASSWPRAGTWRRASRRSWGKNFPAIAEVW